MRNYTPVEIHGVRITLKNFRIRLPHFNTFSIYIKVPTTWWRGVVLSSLTSLHLICVDRHNNIEVSGTYRSPSSVNKKITIKSTFFIRPVYSVSDLAQEPKVVCQILLFSIESRFNYVSAHKPLYP